MKKSMLLLLLFSSALCGQIFYVSDRMDFQDPDQLGHFQQVRAPLNLRELDEDTWLKRMQDQKVVILIHGYNSDYPEALEFFSNIIPSTHTMYGTHICYLWPGGDNFWEYFFAKSRVTGKFLPKRLLEMIEKITAVAETVDAIGHSMGCRLILEALRLPSSVKLHRVFLMAPAIDNEALEREEIYFSATQKCKDLIVFFSRRDNVTKSGYPLLEWDDCMGAVGAENARLLLPHVKMIDCTAFVEGHGDYVKTPKIFDLISNLR